MIEKVIDVKGQNLFIKFNHSFENKPTIVFLHDSLGSVELWRDFTEKLATAVRCNFLVYDRLGYGKSFIMATHKRESNYMELEADLLNDLLSKLNIKDAVLFGHSDGGTIALIAASKYSEKVKALICEAGHIFVEDITVQGVKKALDAYKTTNLPERLQKYHGDKVDTIVKAWTEIWLSDEFRSWNIEPMLKNIICPLLFVQGENDEYGSLDQVDKTFTQVSGNSEKFIIPNVGHTPHKETPEIVLNKSIEFINSTII